MTISNSLGALFRSPTHVSQPAAMPRLEFDSIGAQTDPSDIDQVMKDIELRQIALQQERVTKKKREVYTDFALASLQNVVLGGGLGGLAYGWEGAALGTAMGLYLAFNKTLRKDLGTVTIETNGEIRKTTYYKDPTAYERTREDWTFQKTA